MKSSIIVRLGKAASLAAIMTAAGLSGAAPAPAPAKKPDAPPAVLPQALFVNPVTPEDGKDPFYPRSMRPYPRPGTVPVAPTQVVHASHAELKLNGLSGSPEHPLAIINGRTFELGEEAEVNTPSGKVPIRVLRFKTDGVEVQTPSERRELKLRSGI